jgi:hypothetical protein
MCAIVYKYKIDEVRSNILCDLMRILKWSLLFFVNKSFILQK